MRPDGRRRLLPLAATAVAFALAIAFVTAAFLLHAKISRWQLAAQHGAGAIRRLNELVARVEPLAEFGLAESLPELADGLALVRGMLDTCREFGESAESGPLRAESPRDTIDNASATLRTIESELPTRLAPFASASARAETARWLILKHTSLRRRLSAAIAGIRHEMSLFSIEMRDANDLAQVLIGVACGFAMLVVALLWARQRNLERLLRAQQSRIESNRLLDLLVERAPIILWQVDRDLRFTFARGDSIPISNAGDADSAVGITLQDYFGTADREFQPIAHHLRALAGKPQCYTMRWQERDFITHLEPVRDGERVVAVNGAAFETTAIAQVQDELARTQVRMRHLEKMEAIGRLADFVAHDFNNFLTVVLGYAGSVLSELPPDAPIRFEIEEIARTAERATWLTRQLLAFSRPPRIEPEAIDLAAAVRELAPLLRRQCGEMVDLVLDLATDLPLVLAHRTQIEQIVLNLCLNARDAMADGGTLTLIVSAEAAAEPTVVLAVRDTGIGMDRDVCARIFEPFFSTKDGSGGSSGTGLGLAIVDAIVRERGGTIAVDSAPGRGSTFTVHLPAAIGVEIDRAEQNAEPPPLGRGERVLLVEDDDSVRTLAARTLEAQGYVVTTARGGIEALDIAGATELQLDLLLTDERMPRMSGSWLLLQLRERRPALRAIVMSTHSGASAESAAAAGATFLAKPFTIAELLTCVRSALDAPRPVIA